MFEEPGMASSSVAELTANAQASFDTSKNKLAFFCD